MIKGAINSVFFQNYFPMGFILIDDVSDDGPARNIQGYSYEIKPFSYSFNRGLSAKGNCDIR